MKLNESIPHSTEDQTGLVFSAFVGPILMGLFMWMMDTNPSSMMIPAWMMTVLFICGILIMNVTPVKHLPGAVQYTICAGICAGVNLHVQPVPSIFSSIGIGLIAGLLLFAVIRVNWWFLWDNTSRRTLHEKVLQSIFYTAFTPFGAVMGLYRLCSVGVYQPTTAYEKTADNHDYEVIPENPSLRDHAVLMNAIRSGQTRVDAPNKDAISGSI